MPRYSPKHFEHHCAPFDDVSISDLRHRWTLHALSLGCSICVEIATCAGGNAVSVRHPFRKDPTAGSRNADRDWTSRAHLHIPTSAGRPIRETDRVNPAQGLARCRDLKYKG